MPGEMTEPLVRLWLAGMTSSSEPPADVPAAPVLHVPAGMPGGSVAATLRLLALELGGRPHGSRAAPQAGTGGVPGR